jgi:hypothetical protein
VQGVRTEQAVGNDHDSTDASLRLVPLSHG